MLHAKDRRLQEDRMKELDYECKLSQLRLLKYEIQDTFFYVNRYFKKNKYAIIGSSSFLFMVSLFFDKTKNNLKSKKISAEKITNENN